MNKNIKLALIALIFAACGGDDDITPPPPPPPPAPTPYVRPFPTKVLRNGGWSDTNYFYLGSNGTIDSANQGCPTCPTLYYEYDNSGRIDSSWKIISGGLNAGDSVGYRVWDYPTLDSVTINNAFGLRFGPESWELFGEINDPNNHQVFTLQNDTLYEFQNQQLIRWAFLSDSVNPTYIDYNPCLLLTSNFVLTQLDESKRLPLVMDWVSSPGIDTYFRYEYDAQNRLIKQEWSEDPNFGTSRPPIEFFYD